MSEAIATEEFGVGRCRECGRETLAIPDFEEEGTWRCAHCDERVERTRWVAASELDGLGYEMSDGKPVSTGCTSCVSGGCGASAATAATAPKSVVAGDRSGIPGRANG